MRFNIQQLRNHVRVVLESKMSDDAKARALEMLKDEYAQFSNEWMYLNAKLNELYTRI